MKKFLKALLLILSGMFLGFIFIIVAIIIVALSFSPNTVEVKKNSWLVIDFDGEIREKPISEFRNLLNLSKKEIELLKYIKAIEYAQYDRRIEGILINGDLTFYPKAYAEEITKSIEKFKTSGKKVYAWFSTGENANYNFCLVADKIYMPKTNSASLTLTGYNLSLPYLKEGFDKLGVEFNVLHIGDYKGSGENLVKNSISPQLKESYTTFYDDIYNDFIKSISQKRDITTESLAKLFESGKTIFMTPTKAREYKFVDEIENFETLTNNISFNNFNGVSIYNYSTLLQKKIGTKKIAIVYADGSIYNYYSGSSRFEGDVVGAKSFIKDIEKIKRDESIKAVILRVNSPGGSALASELMLQSILELKKGKPVYVSMGPIAASGGYYISLGGEKIFAQRSTITGSIGVVSVLVNYQKLTDKLGINFETIKKNQYDDIFSPTRNVTSEEELIMIKSMKEIYSEFTTHLIEERNIESNRVPKIAEGRIWTGNQAKEIGLIDEIGGLNDTLQYVIETNDIRDYEIISYPTPPDFFQELQSSTETKIKDTFLNDKGIRQVCLCITK